MIIYLLNFILFLVIPYDNLCAEFYFISVSFALLFYVIFTFNSYIENILFVFTITMQHLTLIRETLYFSSFSETNIRNFSQYNSTKNLFIYLFWLQCVKGYH